MAERLIHLWRLLVLVLLLCAGPVQAHDLGVARIALEEPQAGLYRLDAKLPAVLDASPPVASSGCEVTEQGARVLDRVTKVVSWQVDCMGVPERKDHKITLNWKREGALVMARQGTSSQVSHFIDAQSGSIVLLPANLLAGPGGWRDTAVSYLVLGVQHILIGIDHLAFVLALVLLARGWKLVKLVTAFTVGHSVTLALAVLGWVTVPVPPMEATIALSIAFVAREAMLAESKRHGSLLLVVAFGMLHGLGFASALSEVGVDSHYLLLSLLMFNLGVELGQLLFIAAVLSLAMAWRRLVWQPSPRFAQSIAFGIGSLAVFWTFERVTGFLPAV